MTEHFRPLKRDREPHHAKRFDLPDCGSTAATIDAAVSHTARPRHSERQAQVLANVASCGSYGATREDLNNALGSPQQSACSPVLNLPEDELLREDGCIHLTHRGWQAAVIVAVREVSDG